MAAEPDHVGSLLLVLAILVDVAHLCLHLVALVGVEDPLLQFEDLHRLADLLRLGIVAAHSATYGSRSGPAFKERSRKRTQWRGGLPSRGEQPSGASG